MSKSATHTFFSHASATAQTRTLKPRPSQMLSHIRSLFTKGIVPTNPLLQSPPSKTSRAHDLPFEMLAHITSFLPLPAVLTFASTSRLLRARILGNCCDRNCIARTWIERNAPWWIPPAEHCTSIGPEDSAVSLVEATRDICQWSYLKECVLSGSMRNRRRIWLISEQLARMADELGI